VLAGWFSPDKRMLYGAIMIECVAAGLYGTYLTRLAVPRLVRTFGVAVGLVSVLNMAVAGLYLSGNWDYLRGDALMSSARYEPAVDCYASALKQLENSHQKLLGPPFRWRLSSRGISQDRRVEIYSDLGYISEVGKDTDTARIWYSRALAVARSEGYSATTVADLETALTRVGHD
jgi:hypothetical protein